MHRVGTFEPHSLACHRCIAAGEVGAANGRPLTFREDLQASCASCARSAVKIHQSRGAFLHLLCTRLAAHNGILRVV
eukprot:CAMPEP_0180490974 /NCGR_PEP_ID=MMETSP1036_2-20121128/39402_1 /TAXON_ID=632150 /ORGANISM="Azadinium spinosum, Strain 3D9" /LENGTH=76 /DNA_ID=CAMNT_0022499205 /DNA_START=409 /DNA_END=639 /DNA_ORIENTATION=+